LSLLYKLNRYLQSLELDSKDVEWDLLKMYVTRWENRYKFNEGSTAKMLSYHFILRRHWGIIRIAYISPSIGMYRVNCIVFLLILIDIIYTINMCNRIF